MPILGIVSSEGRAPGAPTIGTATTGSASATVAYTVPTWKGKGSGTVTYTATSSPGGFTGTGASPITVSGLTNGTAYTFTVKATTSYGITGPSSAASNSVTPVVPTAYTSIATGVLSSSGGGFTFSSIPSTYTDLQIRWALISSTSSPVYLQYNGDTTAANYAGHGIMGNGSTASSFGSTAEDGVYVAGLVGAGITSSTYPGVGIVDISDYTNTSKNKTAKSIFGIDANASSTNQTIELDSGLWLSTSAINQIKVLWAGSVTGTIALYGIKAAS